MKQYERKNNSNDYYNFSLHLCNRRFCKIYNLGNMTPKEKAKELYDKMLQWQTDGDIYIQRNITSTSAKQCALIAVDEILNENSIREGNNDEIITYEPYWLKVKQEIEKL